MIFVKIVVCILLSGFLIFSACEGSDTRESVDDTVEELAGKKHVDRMKEMEHDIGRIQDQQTVQRYPFRMRHARQLQARQWISRHRRARQKA